MTSILLRMLTWRRGRRGWRLRPLKLTGRPRCRRLPQSAHVIKESITPMGTNLLSFFFSGGRTTRTESLRGLLLVSWKITRIGWGGDEAGSDRDKGILVFNLGSVCYLFRFGGLSFCYWRLASQPVMVWLKQFFFFLVSRFPLLPLFKLLFLFSFN